MRRHRADDSITKALRRITRVDLIIIDLCRPRDYADAGVLTGGRSGVSSQVEMIWLSGLSA